MNGWGLFHAIRCNDAKTVNAEYRKMQLRERDRFLGSQMLQNDLVRNKQLWREVDEIALELFDRLKKNYTLKSRIKASTGISDCELEKRRKALLPPEGHSEDDLVNALFCCYQQAYQTYKNGENEDSFCTQAVRYRLILGVQGNQVRTARERMQSLSDGIKLETLTMEHLWDLYKNTNSELARNAIISGLTNVLWIDGICYLDQYLTFVDSLNKQFNRMKGSV